MRSEKFQNALGMIDPELVSRANVMPRVHRYKRTVISVAAILAVSIAMGAFWWIGSRDELDIPPSWWSDGGESENYDPSSFVKYLLVGADYPVMAKYPGDLVTDGAGLYRAWRNDIDKQKAYFGAGEGLSPFFEKSVREILVGRGTQNSVYSPLNVYFAVAMMAEFANEEEQSQIFSLLGVNSIEELRSKSNSIWNANYFDDGTVKSLLANSVWLDENYICDEEFLNTFKDSYKASVFKGEFGSSEYDFALRSWINQNTDGLVDRLSDVSLDPSALLALVSTVTFSAKWMCEFDKDKTEKGIFHSPKKKIECDFMNVESYTGYCKGEYFSAVKQDLINSGSVYFILPDKDVSIDKMLYCSDVLSIVSDADSWEERGVRLSVPKFEIQSDIELTEGLGRLGVSVGGVSKISHGAGVSIDEEGAEAAAFTMVLTYKGIPENTIEFVLDRPFMFVITGADGLPLFVGIVNQP